MFHTYDKMWKLNVSNLLNFTILRHFELRLLQVKTLLIVFFLNNKFLDRTFVRHFLQLQFIEKNLYFEIALPIL